MFWKAVPKQNWPTDKEYLATIEKQWEEPFGDMRQEFVFIGQDLDKEAMSNALDKSLLTDSDLIKGKEFWITLSDPFPAWKEN